MGGWRREMEGVRELGGRAGEYDELDMHYSISEAAWKLERGPHRKQ